MSDCPSQVQAGIDRFREGNEGQDSSCILADSHTGHSCTCLHKCVGMHMYVYVWYVCWGGSILPAELNYNYLHEYGWEVIYWTISLKTDLL